MKRFDRAWERMLEGLPESAESLRYISVVVHDPEFVPYFGPGDIVRGSDIPAEILESGREQMRDAGARGGRRGQPGGDHSPRGSVPRQPRPRREPRARSARRLGEPLPAEVIDGDWWNEGQAVTGAVRLSNGARWDSAWIQLLDVYEYRESVSSIFAEEVHSLTSRRRGSSSRRRSTKSRGRRTARVSPSGSSLRGELRARAAPLPRLRRERDRVPDATASRPGWTWTS